MSRVASSSPVAPTTRADSADLSERIAGPLKLRPRDVEAVIHLLHDGNTLPFIARYRKEVTGNLDEVAIGNIEEALAAALALRDRRDAILKSIEAQGLLSEALAARIRGAEDRQTLEDLYLPFKKKRVTRAAKARARGLAPLAEQILRQPRQGDPKREAQRHVGPEVPDAAAALSGARDIASETLAETASIRAMVRNFTRKHGQIESVAVAKAVANKRTPFEDYYDFAEPLGRLASHRYLALCRGEQEGALRLKIQIDPDRMGAHIEKAAGLRRGSPYAGELRAAIADGYKRLLAPSIATELRGALRQRAEQDAVEVFSANLGHLLLAPPFGRKPVIGIDPGFRTGCKCAALTETGRFVAHKTIFPHAKQAEAAQTLLKLVDAHGAVAVAVGNGTAGRETLDFAREALADREVIVVSINEAGASVYSASEIARREFPKLDLTIRGAISIGRRLQDPLAELIKVDPQSLGVGQYQHDVSAGLLKTRLSQVVERCVNRVGVQLNTASAPLLQHVAGIGPVVAQRIVAHRDEQGPFSSRRQLLKVKGLGPKAFEQCAGFLRVKGASNPLDDSAVHPERYALVKQMAQDLGVNLRALVGDAALAGRINPSRYPEVGELTLSDIIEELSKPGRDPRERFEAPDFREDVRELKDLREGMILQGVVTNVAAFGAFVDVGVHQDGLVHVSKLADHFVRDPHAVVAVGQRLKVRVLDVDLQRKRLSLSARDV